MCVSPRYTDATGAADRAGNLLREVSVTPGPVEVTRSFAYNRLYELIAEANPDTGVTLYQYDLNGNRRRKITQSYTDNYGVDANNKLLWVNRNHDAPPAAGQTGRAYTLFGYDATGRMISRDRHDGTNRRVYTFSWDGEITHSQMTKTGMRTLRRGGDHIPDLHLAVRHHDTIDQQLYERSLLGEGRLLQPGSHRGAERFHPVRQPRQLDLLLTTRLQLPLLGDHALVPPGQFLALALELT